MTTRTIAGLVVALGLVAVLAGTVSATHYPPAVQAARQWAQHQLGHIQFRCLDRIVAHESGWNPTAGSVDRSYGIPQANPGWQMAGYGRAWRTDPMIQTHWMLDYIARRYGTACRAWAFKQVHGWY